MAVLSGLLLAAHSNAARAQTTFVGQASGATGLSSTSFVSVASTAPLAASGGAQEASDMETSFAGGLALGASHAAVIGENSATASEASVSNVSFVGSAGFFGATTITADFVMAQATAGCASATAVVIINGLVINGTAIAVTGAANQIVFLSDGGFVIINEQAASVSSVSVNALHVVDAFAGVSVVIATATAGITCGNPTPPPPPPPSGPTPCDFVTGGGWITGTPSGFKANFGVAGGIKEDNTFWGHLNYIDHGTGMHVKQTAVTGYVVDPNDANCRIICYDVTVDGAPGFARVHVCDNGEPGRNDIFEIELFHTEPACCWDCEPLPAYWYKASGDLGGAHPGGGNIQLHKCH